MADYGQDLFDRSDAANLGSDWGACGTFPRNKVLSYECVPNSTGAGEYIDLWVRTGDTIPDDQEASLKMYGDYAVGVVLRGATGAKTCYGGHGYPGTGGGSYIWKYIAGTITYLASGLQACSFGDRLTLTVAGSTIKLYRNGAQIGSVTDTDITTGKWGVVCWPNGAAHGRGREARGGKIGGSPPPEKSAQPRAAASPVGSPYIRTPVYTADTTLFVQSLPDYVVELYKNGASVGTQTTDSRGACTFLVSGLVTSDAFKARHATATSPSSFGSFSTPDVNPVAMGATPPAPEISSTAMFAGDVRVLVWKAKPRAIVEVFVNSVSKGTTQMDGEGIGGLTLATALATNDSVTAKQTWNGATSSASAAVTAKALPTTADMMFNRVVDTLKAWQIPLSPSRLTWIKRDVIASVQVPATATQFDPDWPIHQMFLLTLNHGQQVLTLVVTGQPDNTPGPW